jgi:hypothetical protein
VFEREFFQLAGVMLDCLYHEKHIHVKLEDKIFALTGFLDNASEMRLLIEEYKCSLG